MKKILLCASLLALAGCDRVGFGKAYEISFENSRSVTFTYDPMLTGIPNLQAVAQNECSQYNADAVPDTSPTGGVVRNITFACVDRRR